MTVLVGVCLRTGRISLPIRVAGVRYHITRRREERHCHTTKSAFLLEPDFPCNRHVRRRVHRGALLPQRPPTRSINVSGYMYICIRRTYASTRRSALLYYACVRMRVYTRNAYVRVYIVYVHIGTFVKNTECRLARRRPRVGLTREVAVKLLSSPVCAARGRARPTPAS